MTGGANLHENSRKTGTPFLFRRKAEPTLPACAKLAMGTNEMEALAAVAAAFKIAGKYSALFLGEVLKEATLPAVRCAAAEMLGGKYSGFEKERLEVLAHAITDMSHSYKQVRDSAAQAWLAIMQADGREAESVKCIERQIELGRVSPEVLNRRRAPVATALA